MSMPVCRLECAWSAVAGSNGQLDFTLTHLGGPELRDFCLTYTTLTRADDLGATENATIRKRLANNHEVVPPEGFSLAPGQSWTFSVKSLTRPGVHRTDGVSSAYLTLANGDLTDVAVGDLLLKGRVPTMAPQLVPEGRVSEPLFALPWPQKVEAGDYAAPPVALYPVDGAGEDVVVALAEVLALHKRLFANALPPFALAEVAGGRALSVSEDAGLGEAGYVLSFGDEEVSLSHGDAAGLTYGLITLSQMHHGAHSRPGTFKFPRSGSISDSPRFSWRGCHLDVARQVYDISAVSRFVDVLAWNKMNVLHWHLTDDEGWRIEIKAYPELTEIGSRRGPREKIAAQLGTGVAGSAGYYTQDEIRGLVAHAGRLQVNVMPEFDVPGHCMCVLASLPHLIDPDEEPGSYVSVQGYPNNALNPGMEETYTFLEAVFGEICDLFPFEYIHVGGDEVAHGAWLKSPRAQALMAREGLAGTPELQAFLLGRVQRMLVARGRKLSGWDEVSHGGGVEPTDTLLMAWQKPELGVELTKEGYEVVMCPGQAYYLDMVQADDWLEPGLSWGGTVPPETTYEYEATGNLPPDLAGRIKGVQGCIWSENLTSRERFNHMVFPRLSAIAEAGWSDPYAKDWQRFSALSKLMPTL